MGVVPGMGSDIWGTRGFNIKNNAKSDIQNYAMFIMNSGCKGLFIDTY